MLVDISINEKNFDATLTFNLVDFHSETAFKNTLAIIAMIAGDYSLDPEIEPSELKEMVSKGVEMAHSKLVFLISEEGIEAEYAK